MDVLGHSDIRLRLNTYSHVLEQMQEAPRTRWRRPLAGVRIDPRVSVRV